MPGEVGGQGARPEQLDVWSWQPAMAVGSPEAVWEPLYALYVLLLCAGAVVWLSGASNQRAGRARAALASGGGSGGGSGSGCDVGVVGVGRWRCEESWPCLRLAGLSPPWAIVASRLHRALHRPALGALRTLWPWGCALAGAVLAAGLRSPLPLLAGVGAALLLRRWLRREAERRAAAAREEAVTELCTGVAAELRAGQQPHVALLAVGVHGLGPSGAGVLAAARFGGDLPEALRRAALQPGARGLGGVAACWQVAADGGAGLAEGLERVAAALRVERDQREDVRAQLAGPRATATILALLPIVGLLLGTAMGAEPLQVLLHSGAGWALLAAAAALECAGLAWVRWIVRRAEGVDAEVSRP